METDCNPKILIVDDETSNLAVLNRILQAEYEIMTAKSGKSALKIAIEERPDLILLDVVLPEMSGFDVLTELKNNIETQKIPVIFITGLDNDADEERGFVLGAVDYIKKPFKNAIVKARVRTHMQTVLHMCNIEKLGLTDPLTGIANRRKFDDRMSMEWRRAVREKKSLSLLMMDLDKFKTYNDTYGHPQGDCLLREAAKMFTRRVRRPADLPARIGGEEFAMLLPDTGFTAAASIAEDIRAEMEAMRIPTADDTVMTGATISIGIATAAPAEADSVMEFIASADKNLYAAKENGRNRVFPKE
jgi:diguanylate cyclase (GGDEF)-like protein